ncbi:alanine/glycine:cation symporter family protein [Enterocloster lavalensis]|uniref:alanine/glycine:cation symporter family protein n=1 Tax=Enterocloster lavalensis TaxID=460384 RepID=UPI001D087288|nr:amino acid carrier protein [Enterocloster lavalensis]MCB6345592.1 amino acid carrier protein [Enterocloster lavalensis]
MSKIEPFFKSLADLLWGDWLLFALLGLGLYYTVMTGFIQFKCVSLLKNGFFGLRRERAKVKDQKKCSSYQALCAAIASCVGSGNIVGVSTAILSGGPGALFWMWVAAFFGMATKFGEIVVGMVYHGKDGQGNINGGPMYYIEQGMHWKWAGVFVACMLFVQNAGGTLIQANTISNVVNETFQAPFLITGLVLAVAMSFIISGGFKRLVQVAQRVVPVMAGIYVVGGLFVIFLNAGRIPAMFASIIRGAFSLEAGMGALAGITIREALRFGVARGLYSNEAGEGSAAVLHSSAEVDHPVRQGLYGVIEVFVDTMVICTTTGFTVLITGANTYHTNASTLAAAAFKSVLPGMQYVIYISMILFASTSLMSQWYFGHVSLTYLNKPGWAKIYRIIFPFVIILGSLSSIDMVWSVQDCALGLLILPNIAALICLAPQVRRLTREFMDPENGYLKKGAET